MVQGRERAEPDGEGLRNTRTKAKGPLGTAGFLFQQWMHNDSILISILEAFMATLIIRNVPESLYKILKERAKRNHRSISKEALAVIEEVLDERERMKALGGNWAEVTLRGTFKIDPTTLRIKPDKKQS
jgi:plasmid stability protein